MRNALIILMVGAVLVLGFLALKNLQPQSDERLVPQQGTIDYETSTTITPVDDNPSESICQNEPDCANIAPPPSCDKQDPVYDGSGCLVKCGTPGC